MAIDLIGPDGTAFELDNDDPAALDEALRQGYKQPLNTPAYVPQGLGEQALQLGADATDIAGTAAVGAASGLTGGLFDVALAKNQGNQAAVDTVNQAKEENPLAYGVGEFAGMVASPLSKIGGGISTGMGAASALGRIGATAVGESAVGALFGAGKTMSDAALGDTQLTAEKLIAGAGLGGVLGLAGGGLGSALGEGAQVAARALAPGISKTFGNARKTLEEFAGERWLKAGGGIKSTISKIEPAEREGVAAAIREHLAPPGSMLPKNLDEAIGAVAAEREAVASKVLKAAGVGDAGGLTAGMKQEEALEALGKAFQTEGARSGAVLEKAEAMGARPAFLDIHKRFDDFANGLNPAERDIISGDIEKVRGYLAEMGANPPGPKNGFKALNSIKSTLQSNTNWVADGPAKFGLKRQLVGILRDEIDTQLAPQIGSSLSKEFLEAKQAYGLLSRAEEALGRKSATGADAIEALTKELGMATPETARLSALGHAEKLMRHGIDQKLGNRFVSASDYLTGLGAASMAGGPLGALTGLASSIGHKIIRERGSAVIAKLADGLAKSPSLSAMAQSFAKSLPALTQKLGHYGPILERALARSPAEALATHMAYAQADPDYADTAQLAGLIPEQADEHEALIGRADDVAKVAGQLQEQDAEIARHIEQVFRGTKAAKGTSVLGSQDFGSKRMRRDSADAHQKRVDEIRQLATNPEALIERVSANAGRMGQYAPAVSAAMTASAQRAVQYLAKAAEVPPKAGPLARDWTPTEAERYSFARKLETVQDPMSVFRHAAAGTLTEDQIEAFKAVYPTLARQAADMALERIAENPKSVPYRSRVMLGLLTGVDLDGTMSQAAIAANQTAIHATPKQDEPGAPPSSSSGSRMTLASRLATPDQRREMEGD